MTNLTFAEMLRNLHDDHEFIEQFYALTPTEQGLIKEMTSTLRAKQPEKRWVAEKIPVEYIDLASEKVPAVWVDMGGEKLQEQLDQKQAQAPAEEAVKATLPDWKEFINLAQESGVLEETSVKKLQEEFAAAKAKTARKKYDYLKTQMDLLLAESPELGKASQLKKEVKPRPTVVSGNTTLTELMESDNFFRQWTHRELRDLFYTWYGNVFGHSVDSGPRFFHVSRIQDLKDFLLQHPTQRYSRSKPKVKTANTAVNS